MNIKEAYELYLAGEDVDDPYGTAPDLEFVMYPEEADYVWRLVVLPLEAVGCDLSLDPTAGCSQQEEDQRFDRVRAWMAEKGGVVEALAECPPIARFTDEFGLDLVDGRHRLAIAHQSGITKVRLMLGAAPGWSPSFAVAPGG